MQELIVFAIVSGAAIMLIRGIRASWRGESNCGGCSAGSACAVKGQGEGACGEPVPAAVPVWSERGIPRGGLQV
jgi:hypothetical protein